MLRPGSVWIDVEEVHARDAAAAGGAGVARRRAARGSRRHRQRVRRCGWPASASGCATVRANSRRRMLREQTEPDTVVAAAQQLLAIDRSHEGAWRALMRAYADRGERGMAIQAYERCRAVLADQLDAQPSEETQRPARRDPQGRAGAPRASPRGRSTPIQHARAAAARSARAPIRRGAERPAGPPDAAAEAAGALAPAPSRGGARVGVLPLQLVGGQRSETRISAGHRRRDHRRAGAASAPCIWCRRVRSRVWWPRAATRPRSAARSAIDFLLDGTMQRVRDRLRVSLRLLDLRAGNEIVWSHRFDCDADDMLELQDRGRRRGGGAGRRRGHRDRGAARAGAPVARADRA